MREYREIKKIPIPLFFLAYLLLLVATSQGFVSPRLLQTPVYRYFQLPIQLASSKSTATTTSTTTTIIDWEIYVDQSKASLEKGASATLDAFLGLAPDNVKVIPAILPKTSKSKMPLIRCISLQQPKDLFRASGACLEVANVDSVDKVYRVLTKHLKLASAVKWTACECLKWKYKGNGHLEANEISLAIEAYEKALACHWPDQEGTIVLMRATAYLKRASSHKEVLTTQVQELSDNVPDLESLMILFQQASKYATLAPNLLQKMVNDAHTLETIFSITKYRHGLYQYALLHAAQDALRATQLLPNNSQSWLRAGEILSELWRLGESLQYYELALQLNPELETTVQPIMEGLQKRQDLWDAARAYGWSEDTLRFALDVAA